MTAALRSAFLILAVCPLLHAYVHAAYNGRQMQRSGHVRFIVDPKVSAGLKNRDGAYVITPESDPISALKAAMETWNSASGGSVDMQLTVSSTSNPTLDFVNILTFDDSAATRSMVGSAIAVTQNVLTSGGTIVDSDIVFNPAMTFATTPTLNCFDLQSIATHELGHTLGLGHSVLGSATMFAYGVPEQTWPRHLSSDDIAFLRDVYPSRPVGGIFGTLAFSSGKSFPAAAVLFISPASGEVVASSSVSGSFVTGGLLPGDYLVVATPPSMFNLPGTSTDWQSTFYGDSDPRLVTVTAGQYMETKINVPDGPATVGIEFASQDAAMNEAFGLATVLPSGASATIHIIGKGFAADMRPEDILIYGQGVALHPGSLTTVSAPDLGILSFTLDVASQTTWTDAVLAIRSGTSFTVLSGIRVIPPGPQLAPSAIVNGATFQTGAVAPGELISIFGLGLGSDKPSDTLVDFDGYPASLFYVSPGQINAQVPYEVAASSSTHLRVHYQDSLAEAILPVAAASPGIFAVVNEDGAPNDRRHQAMRGSTVVAYGTGQGAVQPPIATGAVASASPLSTAQVTATVDGKPARVDFAGMAPGFVGLLQVNLVIPDAATFGSVPLTISVNGISSGNTSAYIFVR